MHAGVVTFHINPSQADEVTIIYRDHVIPAALAYGAKSLVLMLDRSSGKGVSTGYWESEAAAREFETSGRFREVAAMLGDRIVSPPVREVYEVVAKTGGASA